jgi:hypothetical protein
MRECPVWDLTCHYVGFTAGLFSAVTQTLAGYLGLSCILCYPSVNFARSKREASARFPLLFLAKSSIFTCFVWL